MNDRHPGFVVIADKLGIDRLTAVGVQDDRVRIHHQVPDGQQHAVSVQQHGIALSFGAQGAGAERIFRHLGCQPDNRRKRRVQIELVLFLFRVRRKFQRRVENM